MLLFHTFKFKPVYKSIARIWQKNTIFFFYSNQKPVLNKHQSQIYRFFFYIIRVLWVHVVNPLAPSLQGIASSFKEFRDMNAFQLAFSSLLWQSHYFDSIASPVLRFLIQLRASDYRYSLQHASKFCGGVSAVSEEYSLLTIFIRKRVAVHLTLHFDIQSSLHVPNSSSVRGSRFAFHLLGNSQVRWILGISLFLALGCRAWLPFIELSSSGMMETVQCSCF